jgi:hypothetical protein
VPAGSFTPFAEAGAALVARVAFRLALTRIQRSFVDGARLR